MRAAWGVWFAVLACGRGLRRIAVSHNGRVSSPMLVAEAVRGERCAIGFVFDGDGDGDRVGLVDETGAIVWADQLILLLAQDVLAERPGSAIVADVKSSNILFDGIAAAGGL